MRVVFLQDVPNVAKAGEIKEVAAGYGRNFLIPRKLAALASPQAMSQVETSDKVQARTSDELVELARQLEGKEVSLRRTLVPKNGSTAQLPAPISPPNWRAPPGWLSTRER